MKLLFFSPNSSEVAEVSKELETAGIACEVRRHSAKQRASCDFDESEIWIQHDRDCHRALLVCVSRGVGFARRPARSSMIESWTDITNGTDVFENEPQPCSVESEAVDIKHCAQAMRKLKAA
jgi:hypothetical protein